MNEKDAERWRFYCCPQTALTLGTELDPNDQSVDWYKECSRLASRGRYHGKIQGDKTMSDTPTYKEPEKLSAPSFWSRLQCRLSLCGGHMEHVRDANGKWWIGLRCTATGTLHSPILSRYQDAFKPEGMK